MRKPFQNSSGIVRAPVLPANRHILEFGSFRFDLEERLLYRAGALVPLTPKVLETLALFLTNPERLISRDEMIAALWPDSVVEESGLARNISLLRKALEEGNPGVSFIETIPKRGYRFVGPVTPLPNPGGEAPDRVPAIAAPARYWFWGLTGVVLCAVLALFWLRPHFAAGSAGAGASHAVASTPQFRQITSDSRRKIPYSNDSQLFIAGSDLYFWELEGDKSLLGRVAASGGDVSTIALPSHDTVPYSLAPDGKSLLLGHKPGQPGEFSIFRLPSGPAVPLPRNIGTGGGILRGVPVPDELTYAAGHSIFTAGLNGENRRKLAEVDGQPGALRWSSDGKLLRFDVLNAHKDVHTIRELSAAPGALPHPLLREHLSPEGECCGSWDAAGEDFVFTSYHRFGTTSDIWVLEKGKTEPRQITSGPLRFYTPVFSADKTAIFAVGEQPRGQLMRMDRASGNFVPYLFPLSAEAVRPSPDGKWLAYASFPDGRLYICRADGSGKRQLTSSPVIVRSPYWSPDGRSIVYLGALPGGLYKIFRVGASGGSPEPVWPEDNESEGVATWSGDGQRILFGRLRAVPNNGHMVILQMDLTTRKVEEIRGSEGLWTARWSPDGRYISAVTVDNHSLMLFDPKTEQWSKLAGGVDIDGGFDINDTVWSRDSSTLYFDTSSSSDPAIYRVRFPGRRVERVAGLRQTPLAGPYGPSLGVTPEGEPLVLRDETIQEIWAIGHWR
jgi:Tol biopolymer transport system component/DNA-binding winged helix-turn-helix (wHTH) protein